MNLPTLYFEEPALNEEGVVVGKMPDELRERIAANIRTCREFMFPGRGGSRRCAEMVGVSPQQWSPWERGSRTPDEVRMRQIGDFFGVSVDWLRAADAGRIPEPDDYAPQASDEQKAFWSSLETFHPDRLGRRPLPLNPPPQPRVAPTGIPAPGTPTIPVYTIPIIRQDIYIAGCFLSTDEKSYAIGPAVPPELSAMINNYFRFLADTIRTFLERGIIFEVQMRSHKDNRLVLA